tara:strand:+ start:4403 stop:4864 length:462 start_codon:yes stop_codon:yes gene_type:complete
MDFKTEVIFTAVIYFGYFVAALVALVLLGVQPLEDGVLEYAYYVVYVTCGLHFGATAYGFARGYWQGEEYALNGLLPVEPKWAFFFADILMAMALGGTIAAHFLDHDNHTPVVIGNATVMGTQGICAWKTYRLLFEIDSGERSAQDGSTSLFS